MTGTPDDALEAYHTADLIDSDSVWTLRRIAALLVRAAATPMLSHSLTELKP